MMKLNEYINECMEQDIYNVQIDANDFRREKKSNILYDLSDCEDISEMVEMYINNNSNAEEVCCEKIKGIDFEVIDIYEYFYNEYKNANDDERKELLEVFEDANDINDADDYAYSMHNSFSYDYWYYINGEEVGQEEFYQELNYLKDELYADYMGINVELIN